MIASMLIWWLVSSILGIIAMPLSWRLFHRLPDRGFGFTRAFGVMAASYLLWIGASFGFLRNSLGGAILVLFLLSAISVWVGIGRWHEIRIWLRSKRRMILVMEGLFFLAFIFWAFVRANNPALDHTEQPMELAFLNAIQRSEVFPPRDPWLSGYAISYYYFGYIQLSLLTTLARLPGAVGFNLGNALWFGLSVLGTYSLVYNLLEKRDGRPRLGASLLGPIFVLITGNLEGFLEVLNARQIFWRQNAQGELVSSFWRWLNIKTLVESPFSTPTWMPTRHWWWWRASRVVNDLNLLRDEIEIIDEFPFFSFLLADNHPHLLALPFVLMGVGLALQVFLAGESKPTRLGKTEIPLKNLRLIQAVGLMAILLFSANAGVSATAEGVTYLQVLISVMKSVILGVVALWVVQTFTLTILGSNASILSQPEFWFGAWLFGGIIFLNTWDSPIYLSLFVLCMWWRIRSESFRKGLKLTLQTAVALGAGAVLFYLPWYPSFSSQLGGILPNLIFPTRLPQFLVMFAPALVPIAWWLVRKVRMNWQSRERKPLIVITLVLPLALLLMMWILGAVIVLVLRATDPAFFEAGMSRLGAQSIMDLVAASFSRLWTGWTALALGAIAALGMLLLWRKIRPEQTQAQDVTSTWPFVAMIALIGALLILAPEFVFLRDQFGTRMNTIFKFYFAAWILWGVAAAYAVTEIWRWSWRVIVGVGILLPMAPTVLHLWDLSRTSGLGGSTQILVPWVVWLYLLGWVLWVLIVAKAAVGARSFKEILQPLLTSAVFLPLFLGLFYPSMALWTKTSGFNPPDGRTLNGSAFVERLYSSDYDAIQWIKENLPVGVIAEASKVNASYTYFARVSTHTGFPTVLGWPGHEYQWRGGGKEMGSRQDDIARLYQSRDWLETQDILDQYGIDYVYVGSLERQQYERLYEGKFEVFMNLIFQNGEVRIYAR